MNSIWKSLLWKEWREQRWRLVALTALILLPAGWFFSYFAAPTIMPFTLWDNLSILAAFANCYIVLAGCFLGMHLVGGENALRTMRFMQAEPTAMWQPGLVKLFVGWFVAVLPLVMLYSVLCTVLPFLIDENTLDLAIKRLVQQYGYTEKNIYGWSLHNLAIGAFGVTSLLLWMSAGGVNRSDEVRAGAVGFLVCLSAWMVFGFLMVWADKHSTFWERGLLYLIPALPGGPAISLGMPVVNYKQFITPLLAIVGIASHSAILYWYLRRFGRIAVPPKRAGSFEFNLSRWKHISSDPMRSQWRAIAWKQLRETGPLAALTVACILMITPVVYWINVSNRMEKSFGEMLGGITLSASFFCHSRRGDWCVSRRLRPGYK